MEVLSTVAIYSADGHRAVLAALEELYLFHSATDASADGAESSLRLFEPLVERLKSASVPRGTVHGLLLTLLNSVVNGAPSHSSKRGR